MKLSEHIQPLVQPLLDAGLAVHVYDDGTPRKKNWLVVEKDGNVGSIGYRDYAPFGYYVTFCIKPSREIGSGLLVLGEHDKEPCTVEEVVELAQVAVRDSYSNFATDGRAIPNHGWKHFDWAKSRISEITADDLEETEVTR